MASIAQDIATQINSSWVTPAVVQTFLALSKPVRLVVKDFLSAQEANIAFARGKLNSTLRVGDVLSDRLTALQQAASELLDPVDRLLAAIPLDSVAKESPEISTILQNIADSVPLKIPATVGTTIAGIGGFDFFEGITTYRDLRDKIDELGFRLSRATALSNYASAGTFYFDNQLNKIRAYKQVIDLLND